MYIYIYKVSHLSELLLFLPYYTIYTVCPEKNRDQNVFVVISSINLGIFDEICTWFCLFCLFFIIYLVLAVFDNNQ